MSTPLQCAAKVLTIALWIGTASIGHAQSTDITEPSEPKRLGSIKEKDFILSNVSEPTTSQKPILELKDGDFVEIGENDIAPLEQCRDFAKMVEAAALLRGHDQSPISEELPIALKKLSRSMAIHSRLPALMEVVIMDLYKADLPKDGGFSLTQFVAQQRDIAELACLDELNRPWWRFW